MNFLLKFIVPAENFFDWLTNLIITDEYLERREKEWEEAKLEDIYLS